MRYLRIKVKNLLFGGMCKPFAIITLLLFSPVLLMAQQDLVIISGDTVFSRHTLEGESPSTFPVLQSLLTRKQSRGHYQAGIDSLHLSGDSMIAYYHQGPKYSLEVSVSGAIISSADTLLYSFDNYSMLTDKVEILLMDYRNRGYPFASAHSHVTTADSNHIFVHINIHPCQLFWLDTILVRESPSPVSSSFLHASLNFDNKGEVFSEKRLKDIESRINRMDFLEQTAPPKLVVMSDYSGVKLGLRQRSANMLDGIMGFSSDDNEKLMLNGNVNMRLINQLGHGENLQVRWTAPGNQSQSLDIQSGIPYIAGTPFGTEAAFSLYKQDSSYLNLSLEAGLPYRFSYDHYAAFFYRYETSNVMASSSLHTEVPPSYTAHGAGVSYHYSTLSERGIYRTGWHFHTRFSGLVKSSEEKAPPIPQSNKNNVLNHRIADISLKAHRYQKTGSRSILLIQSNNKYLQDENAGKNQLFRTGGFRTLRGFDQDEFYAVGYSIMLLEYRFYPDDNTFFALFWNGAALKTIDKNIRLPHGAGGGLGLKTNAGILKLYYALGKEQNTSFKLNNSKVHMGFISTF